MKKMSDLANRKENAVSVILEAGQDFRKNEILANVVPEQYARLHNARTCHIHDLEYYDVTYNCIGVSVCDLIGNKSRSFVNMLRALHRGIVELTNLQSGGIGFINFDADAAQYVGNEPEAEIVEAFREFFLDLNMNTRKGCEDPYVTFNFGLDTSKAGRKVTSLMLEAYAKGDDRGNPFRFPNMVFKIKRGVNAETDSINYDLYQKSLRLTAKRMVPTYYNCDSTSNLPYLPEKIGIMGCRTRVVTNINGAEGSLNRGNVACVTLNLVQMAYQAKQDRKEFYRILDENLENAKGLLLHRLQTLCKVGNFHACYEKGYYMGAKQKDAFEMLKNGTLSIGFIGLWDAVGTIHGEEIDSLAQMKQYYPEAYRIVRHMREFTDRATFEEGLNLSLLASAAEGVTGNFAQYDGTHLGKGYYTNSFHVPVGMNISYRDKIQIEGGFHRLCNGGSITYVELREMPANNVEAVQEIVEYACQNDCNYIGINFPMDFCMDCGYMGRIAVRCPKCSSSEIRRLRRVSGYLAEDTAFTQGKKKELKERKAHAICP